MAADSGMDTCPSPEIADSRKRPLDGDNDNGDTKRSHFSSGNLIVSFRSDCPLFRNNWRSRLSVSCYVIIIWGLVVVSECRSMGDYTGGQLLVLQWVCYAVWTCWRCDQLVRPCLLDRARSRRRQHCRFCDVTYVSYLCGAVSLITNTSAGGPCAVFKW